MELIEQLKAEVIRFLDEEREFYLRENDDGTFIYEIDAEAGDELSEDTIKKCIQSNHPREAIYEHISEIYEEYRWSIENDIINSIIKDERIAELLSNENTKDVYDNRDYIVDILSEILIITEPVDHFMNQDIQVDIIVDTGDLNYDYTLNCVYPHYNGQKGETIDEKASILWLTKQQGYKKSDLNKALREEDFKNSKLLKSIQEEVANCSSHMNALTFCVEMTLNDFLNLQEKIEKEKTLNSSYEPKERKGKDKITIKKETECGLYDCWNGAGSLLNLQLEKDVVLPLKYIDTALPDGSRGYGIHEIYGDGYWKHGEIIL